MTEVEFANLTNGVLCAPAHSRFTRIPSTWCEQKHWGRLLMGAGPELVTHAALGHTVVVHDQSERKRQTRAQWQGLSWLRYACSAAWGLPTPLERSRNGMNITSYWAKAFRELDDSSKNWLEYFKEISESSGIQSVDIQPCECARIEWKFGNGKELLWFKEEMVA